MRYLLTSSNTIKRVSRQLLESKNAKWYIFCFVTGLILINVYPDNWELDGGYHYLFAKWALKYPSLFVGVWSRPLFTILYVIPAQIGHTESRLFTVLLGLYIAFLTYKLGKELNFINSDLLIPLMWLQPIFYLYYVDTMTELVFSLVLVQAFRLYNRGRYRSAYFVISLTVLARPEGIFLCTTWAIFELAQLTIREYNKRNSNFRNRLISVQRLLPLAFGLFVWWILALMLTYDPLFIFHNWPSNWAVVNTDTRAHFFQLYPLRLPEIAGFFVFPAFIIGLYNAINEKRMKLLAWSFLIVFSLHTIMNYYGWFGSVGYPRYMLTLSPVVALITLFGLNNLARYLCNIAPVFKRGALTLCFLLSWCANFLYADGHDLVRDTDVTAKVVVYASKFRSNNRVSRFIWSDPLACILSGDDPFNNLYFTKNRENDLSQLRNATGDILVYWDQVSGSRWTAIKPDDFIQSGYTQLYSENFTIKGKILERSLFGHGGPRDQQIYLFYKSDKSHAP